MTENNTNIDEMNEVVEHIDRLTKDYINSDKNDFAYRFHIDDMMID